MTFETISEPSIGFPSGHRQKPAVLLQSIEKLEDALEQRLFDFVGRAKGPERALIILGQPIMLFRRRLGHENFHCFDKTKTDDLARNVRRRNGKSVISRKRSFKCARSSFRCQPGFRRNRRLQGGSSSGLRTAAASSPLPPALSSPCLGGGRDRRCFASGGIAAP